MAKQAAATTAKKPASSAGTKAPAARTTGKRSGAKPMAGREATSAEKKLAQQGVVQADTRQQTRTVTIAFAQPHAKYGKMIRKKTVLQVHDEGNESRRGDLVEVAPCRPISKTKRWRLLRVVERRSVIDATLEAPKV